MFGYVFIAENHVNGKKYIGKRYAVGFDKNYFGDIPAVTDDVIKHGASNFTVKMLMPYESAKAVDAGLDEFIAKYHALEDQSFYNCDVELIMAKPEKVEKTDKPATDKPKRTNSRRKKAE